MKLIPTSRRYFKNKWHPYGWQIGFKQSVRWPDGSVTRHYFSDIGTDKGAAIWNALRALDRIIQNV